MKKEKPILLLDFDGVLNSYSSGWKGARVIPDPPVPGALEFIVEAIEHFQVCIYSARSRHVGGKRAMKKWLRKHYIEMALPWGSADYKYIDFFENPFFDWTCETAFADPWPDAVRYATRRLLKEIKFPTKKPPAFLTIDDRAICFTGEFPDTADLMEFKPWYEDDG